MLILQARQGTRAPTKKRIRDLDTLSSRLQELLQKKNKESLGEVSNLVTKEFPWKGKIKRQEFITKDKKRCITLENESWSGQKVHARYGGQSSIRRKKKSIEACHVAQTLSERRWNAFERYLDLDHSLAKVEPRRIGTASIDTTCTIWDVEKGVVETQLVMVFKTYVMMLYGDDLVDKFSTLIFHK
ncbi:hypothetical protein Tco_1165925 [Tanacetum coccineum]